jgi:Spy/CpxP family protein refolding chaperone
MNEVLKWKLIAGFLLVFVAGGIAGAALGGLYAKHLFFEFHHPGMIGARMKEQFRSELHLTAEQAAKINPIIDKTAAELQQVRRDTSRRVGEIWREAHRQIAGNLTEEQRQKLQQMKERHHRWQHRHGLSEYPPESTPTTP